jgi:EAL domain-containing protein (putative c-di-GMP-specific phosphodiesterase class I)
VSVNLSIRQLDHPELARRVAEALDRHHLNPADVLFEISQGSLALDVDLAAARLRQLKKLGVRLAVDDFVAATPSLSSLAPFPLDELKIDRSLVAGLGDPDTRHLVGGIIAEAASRGLSTVAEGVETAAQVRDLFELRCEDAQGFYFLPPVAPAELSGVIDSSLANGRLHSATMAGGTA